MALAYGWYLVRKVLREDPGTPEMQEIALAIEEGAMAYLGRQVRTMIWFVILITIGLYLMYQSLPDQYPHPLPIGVAVAFLMGVMASHGAGYVGMWLAVKANLRAANAALKGFKPALELAFRAGTVSGMFTVGFGLLGAVLIFMIFREDAMKVLVGFGFGGSLAALFMRVGGGIFTKAADIGADLVGKVEQNIPEDDPRNAAVIADNVGDNVGDCAGMAADVFESYEVTLVAAIILAAVLTVAPDFREIYGDASSAFALKLIIFPYSSGRSGCSPRSSVRGRSGPKRSRLRTRCGRSASATGQLPWYQSSGSRSSTTGTCSIRLRANPISDSSGLRRWGSCSRS